jgi:hypothetical protein
VPTDNGWFAVDRTSAPVKAALQRLWQKLVDAEMGKEAPPGIEPDSRADKVNRSGGWGSEYIQYSIVYSNVLPIHFWDDKTWLCLFFVNVSTISQISLAPCPSEDRLWCSQVLTGVKDVANRFISDRLV